ncbi:hypothetical protein [Candidatus Protochlamydia amoebophila]|uniref:hypothetical protein n=1 Tax=Candidatus Protochlamydia amoebophila TaxID=362787 RepID=UPI001BC9362B|nr:hypothetical protein [Candidatus Protochlamydia amoebophila]
MKIHGLIPLQKLMNQIQNDIATGNLAKANLKMLAIPIFEAAGCICVIGNILFKSVQNEGFKRNPEPFYRLLGKAGLLAFNILFGPYYMQRNPKACYQYHVYTGLISDNRIAPSSNSASLSSPICIPRSSSSSFIKPTRSEKQIPRNSIKQNLITVTSPVSTDMKELTMPTVNSTTEGLSAEISTPHSINAISIEIPQVLPAATPAQENQPNSKNVESPNIPTVTSISPQEIVSKTILYVDEEVKIIQSFTDSYPDSPHLAEQSFPPTALNCLEETSSVIVKKEGLKVENLVDHFQTEPKSIPSTPEVLKEPDTIAETYLPNANLNPKFPLHLATEEAAIKQVRLIKTTSSNDQTTKEVTEISSQVTASTPSTTSPVNLKPISSDFFDLPSSFWDSKLPPASTATKTLIETPIFSTPQKDKIKSKTKRPPSSPEKGTELKTVLRTEEDKVIEIQNSIDWSLGWLTSLKIDPTQSFQLKVKSTAIQTKDYGKISKQVLEFKKLEKPTDITVIKGKFLKLIQSSNFSKFVLDQCSYDQLKNLYENLNIIKNYIDDSRLIIPKLCQDLENRMIDKIIQKFASSDTLNFQLHRLISSMLSRLYPLQGVPEGRSEGPSQRLMRQNNPSNTLDKLDEFFYQNIDPSSFTIFESYAILKRILMQISEPNDEGSQFKPIIAFFSDLRNATSKDAFINKVIEISDLTKRAFVIDLLSLLYGTLQQVWLPEEEEKLKKDVHNPDVQRNTANAMLTGGMIIASLFCPTHSYIVSHDILIDVLLDYPTQFKRLKASFPL